MDEEKEDDWVEIEGRLYFHASQNLDGENSNLDAIKRLDGLLPYTIDAWLHVSGQERLSEVLKIGNMAKQQFCSSHGALNFVGCIGRSGSAFEILGGVKRGQDCPSRLCK